MYIDILFRRRDAVKGIPQKVKNQKLVFPSWHCFGNWLVLVKDFLPKNNVETLEHPIYSADLAAADFYFFLECSLNDCTVLYS